MKIDGSDLASVLALIGETIPAEDTEELLGLEAAIGAKLPEESRAMMRARPELLDPSVENHPEITSVSFDYGLPDVEEWLTHFEERPILGRYLATMHFVGLVPIGAQINRGDFMYAGLVMEEHAPGVGGVMYYDERELGTWGGTCSSFLYREICQLWQELEGELEDLEPEERAEAELDFDDLRDCFPMRGYAAKGPPAAADPAPDALKTSWKKSWRRRMALTERWWLSAFLAANLGRHSLGHVPVIATWEEEKVDLSRYADAMYWLLAHAALDNRPELEECLALTESHPGTHVQALREAVAGHALAARWESRREKLYEIARRAG